MGKLPLYIMLLDWWNIY